MTRAAVALALALAVTPAGALAQPSGPDLLAQAEQAYLEVDFERTFALSQRALEAGGHATRRLVRIYELIGLSAAAIGNEDASRDAYIRMLALAPDAQVDRNLAPRLRSPFLEARGFWTSRSERLEADVTFLPSRNALRVRLSDPLGMASRVVAFARPAETGSFTSFDRGAAESLVIELTGMPEDAPLEYYVQIVDSHGNRIVEVGDEIEPRVTGELSTGNGEPGGARDGLYRRWWLWVAVGAAALGLALGGYFLFRDDSIELQPVVTFQ